MKISQFEATDGCMGTVPPKWTLRKAETVQIHLMNNNYGKTPSGARARDASMGAGAAKVGSVGNENRLSRFDESLIPNSAPIGASEVGDIGIENRVDPFEVTLSLKTSVVVRARDATPTNLCQNAAGSTQRRWLIERSRMANRGVGGLKSKK